MLHIDIVCVGKIRESYLKDAIAEYQKRLSKYCILNIIELPDEKLPSKLNDSLSFEIKQKESNLILSHIKKDSYIIALDLKGKNYTSTQFSEKIQNLSLITSHITFLIGGTLGMTDELLANAKELICFSKMTFPHPLIRLFLLEQLFRGFKIMNGENYHH
jgi:ribosomal RNA large subunit methyltransferase H 1